MPFAGGDVITLDGTNANAETVSKANVNRRFYTQKFSIKVSPADDWTSTTVRKILTVKDGNFFLGRQGVAKQFRLRLDGNNFTFTLATQYAANAELEFIVDFRAGTITVYVDDVEDSSSPFTITGGASKKWFNAYSDVFIGQNHLGNEPWNGTIERPIGVSSDPMTEGNRLWLVMGHSNAQGKPNGATTDTSYFFSYPNCRFYHRVNGVASPSTWNTTDLDNLGATDDYGVELPFGRILHTYTSASKEVGIVKVTQGGTGVGPDAGWLPSSQGGPGANLETLYEVAWNAHAAFAIEQTASCGWGGAIVALGDNSALNSASSSAFLVRMRDLISEVRAITEVSNLPIYLMGTATTDGSWPFADDIRTDQATLASEDANVHLIVTSGAAEYPLRGDNVHFTADALMNLGNDFGDLAIANGDISSDWTPLNLFNSGSATERAGLWLTTDLGVVTVTSGAFDAVDIWKDQSPYGFDMTSSLNAGGQYDPPQYISADSDFNNLPTVFFNQTSSTSRMRREELGDLAVLTNESIEALAVIYLDTPAPAGTNRLFNARSSVGYEIRMLSNTDFQYVYDATSGADLIDLNTDLFGGPATVIRGQFSASNDTNYGYVTGSLADSEVYVGSAEVSTNVLPFTIAGNSSPATGGGGHFRIAELIIRIGVSGTVGANFTEAERAELTTYLNNKYGFTLTDV